MLEDFERASIVVLGSGTSMGIPMVGCHCKTCTSTDPRDKRLRPSVLIKLDEHRVLIDTAPDFRLQALRAPIERIDAVLYTHSHADHIMGLDDLRPFNFMQKSEIPIFGSPEALDTIKSTFPYVFNGVATQSSKPKLVPHTFADGERIPLFGMDFETIKLCHGIGTAYGFKFGDCAYLTDHSAIPEESMKRLQNLDVLFLDALRYTRIPPIKRLSNRFGQLSSFGPEGLSLLIFRTTSSMRQWRPGCLRMYTSPTMASISRSARPRDHEGGLSIASRREGPVRPLRAGDRQFRWRPSRTSNADTPDPRGSGV